MALEIVRKIHDARTVLLTLGVRKRVVTFALGVTPGPRSASKCIEKPRARVRTRRNATSRGNEQGERRHERILPPLPSTDPGHEGRGD
jgi:hypothetical protein